MMKSEQLEPERIHLERNSFSMFTLNHDVIYTHVCSINRVHDKYKDTL